jgi:hypothetical protein
MSIQMILLPLFVQVAMTIGLGFWLGGARVPAVRRGEVRLQDIALREPNWPKRVLQISNSYQNQFEVPMLYYLLTVLVIVTKQAGTLFIVLSWMFVLSRLAHAYVHVTDNHLARRGVLFGIGAVVLTIMWLVFVADILIGPI